MRTSGNPTVEECAERVARVGSPSRAREIPERRYARAKAALEEAEREEKKKYPDAPAGPARQKAVPFGHLRVSRDAPAFDEIDDDGGGELELLEGGFDISDGGAATRKPRKKAGSGFGRGFLN